MRHLIPSSTLLRAALLGDAAASGGMGLLLTAATHPMASLLALPEPLLRGAGLVLLPLPGWWHGLVSSPACRAGWCAAS